MSVRLRILNSILRSFVKPRLARTKDPLSLRRRLELSTSLLLPSPPSEARFEEDTLTRNRSADGALAIRWCRFGDQDPAEPTNAAILYLHGGAFIAGSAHTHRSVIWPLARAAHAPVAALEYRRAPEHVFPAAFDDSMDALEALSERLGPQCRIAIAGDSAGGGLALSVAAAAQKSGAQPVALAVFSPFADLALTGRSLKHNARRDPMLPAHRIAEAAQLYLGEADARDPRASPLYAHWSAPPPTLIQASQAEALRDDATRMAEKLRAAGGDVRLEMWRHTPHAWQFFAPWVAEAADAVSSAGRFLAAHLHGANAAPAAG